MLRLSHPRHVEDMTTKTTTTTTRLPDPDSRRPRAPDWGEFYKNGLPGEIIVIEDTPDPSPGSANNAASTNGYAVVPTAQSASSKKRKLDDEEGTQKTEQPRRSHAPNGATAASTATARAEGEDRLPNQKKRRTSRYQSGVGLDGLLYNEQSRPRPSSYKGLDGPVTKAKDVHIGIRQQALGGTPRSTNGEDGHYIVVPDGYLTNQYRINKLIGQGTFGKVVEAYDRRNKRAVAIKVIRSVQKYRDAAKIELRVLQTLRHNDSLNKYRCIHLQDCFDLYGHICIVTSLYDLSLFDFLKDNSFVPFPNSHIQSFAKQLLTSVAYIHDLGLIHTDLKPENILLDSALYQTFTYNRRIPSARSTSSRQATQRRVLLNPDIRLIDFGSATFQDEYHSSVVSTRHYRAPEIILGLGWSFPCDIWSIGCILVEFFTGDALFQTHDNLEHLAMMEAVFDARIDIDMARQAGKTNAQKREPINFFKRLRLNYPNQNTDRASRRFVKGMRPLKDVVPATNGFMKQFLDLLTRMFAYNPANRITAKQALAHPWFREYQQDDGTEAAKIAQQRQNNGLNQNRY